MEEHKQAVDDIEARVRHFHDLQQPFRNYHGSTTSTRLTKRDNIVDTSQLNHVLYVDISKKTVTVEPNVSMVKLVKATLEHALIPVVVMEFYGITVGGGFSGSSGESSSFRHGLFESTVNWIEIVIPTGETVKASRTERPDLFWGAASSLGTLGVVTLLEVQLRDAAKYVELTYLPVSTMAEALKIIQEEMVKPTIDYVDGIMYSKDHGLICSGRLTDTLPAASRIQQFTRRHDSWFYLHAKSILKRAKPSTTEYVPLVDYVFRFERGAFWTGRFGFKYFYTPFNRITRYLLDSSMHTHVMLRALHSTMLSNLYMVQDVSVPFPAAEELNNWLAENMNIYPLWLCPVRFRRTSPDSGHGLHAHSADPATPEYLLNFGIWGDAGWKNRTEAVRQNRALEAKVHQIGGIKVLYAHAYYTEEEFWSIYRRPGYDDLREKYGATYLPSVFDKVKTDLDIEAQEEALRKSSLATRIRHRFWVSRPFHGLYGVYKAWVGGEYLLQRKSKSIIMAIKKE
jgi:FAD/FMN-containing dehydrogenase